MDLHFLFAHGEPFTLCNHGVRIGGLSGTFLSTIPPIGMSATAPLGFLARAQVGQFGASTRELTFLMIPSIVLHLHSVFPFTSNRLRRRGYSRSAVIPKEEATRQRSPHHRVVVSFHLRLIDTAYRPSDGVESHRYNSEPFFPRGLHVSPHRSDCIHHTHAVGKVIKGPPVLRPGAVIGTPQRPKCRHPGSLCLAPSSPLLLRTSRWSDTSCVPPSILRGSSREFCTGVDPHR